MSTETTREAAVERLLDLRVNELGGMTLKLAPVVAGAPDRLVLLDGQVWFVELKSAVGILSPIQLIAHKRLEARGAKVVTLYGLNGVEEFVKRSLQ